jgi:outer membrane protein OmpA-like peptidoglycan-associated protein
MKGTQAAIIFLFLSSLAFSQQKKFIYKNFSDSCFKPGNSWMIHALITENKKLTASKDSLKKIAEFLKSHPLFKVEIGFNGNGAVPNPAFTKAQGIEWRNFLFNECGIDTLRFYFEDYKSTRPIHKIIGAAASKKTEEKTKENRRVEITVRSNSYFPYKNKRKDRNAGEYFLGDIIDLPEILFDLGKGGIRPESKDSLKKWAKFIFDRPGFIFEISSHTDARGSSASNLKISEMRISSVFDYLVNELKIPKERLFAKGYGETQLLATDDEILKQSTKEEKEVMHQRNRRTELRIVGKVGDCNFFYNP